MDDGLQCVTTIGITRKPSWCVGNWAILLQVIRYLVHHTWAEEKFCTAIHCCHTNLYMIKVYELGIIPNGNYFCVLLDILITDI